MSASAPLTGGVATALTETADRAVQLRRMATGLLVVMAVLFLLARHYQHSHGLWPWVLAFAEAGMVGGIADWFAVTALFRRPLGLPIPHTAIIPENKGRIADTLAAFLRDNFLTPQVVARRLAGMNLAGAAGDWLADPARGGSTRMRDGAAELLAQILETLDPDRLGNQVRGGLFRQLDRLEVSPLLGQMLNAAIADQRHMPVIDTLVRWAGLTLEDNEDMVREMIHRRANAVLRWTGLDEKLANSVLDGLYKLLAEVIVDPHHPLRGKVEEGIAKLAADLEHDPALRERVERVKGEVIANPAVSQWWQGVWERFRQGMLARLRRPAEQGNGQLAEAMAELGRHLRDNADLQVQINRFARRSVVGVVNRYGDQIVQMVSETVKRWDAQTVTDRMENAVGRDLQFIRFNGTLVGGMVGLAIHAVDVWL